MTEPEEIVRTRPRWPYVDGPYRRPGGSKPSEADGRISPDNYVYPRTDPNEWDGFYGWAITHGPLKTGRIFTPEDDPTLQPDAWDIWGDYGFWEHKRRTEGLDPTDPFPFKQIARPEPHWFGGHSGADPTLWPDIDAEHRTRVEFSDTGLPQPDTNAGSCTWADERGGTGARPWLHLQRRPASALARSDGQYELTGPGTKTAPIFRRNLDGFGVRPGASNQALLDNHNGNLRENQGPWSALAVNVHTPVQGVQATFRNIDMEKGDAHWGVGIGLYNIQEATTHPQNTLAGLLLQASRSFLRLLVVQSSNLLNWGQYDLSAHMDLVGSGMSMRMEYGPSEGGQRLRVEVRAPQPSDPETGLPLGTPTAWRTVMEQTGSSVLTPVTKHVGFHLGPSWTPLEEDQTAANNIRVTDFTAWGYRFEPWPDRPSIIPPFDRLRSSGTRGPGRHPRQTGQRFGPQSRTGSGLVVPGAPVEFGREQRGQRFGPSGAMPPNVIWPPAP